MAAKNNPPPRPERLEGEERKKALAAALANIEKQFGKGSIMRMAEGSEAEDIETVSTGSLGLDLALGVGGLPRGRIIEIYGPESSGKTTLALQVIAEMQEKGGTFPTFSSASPTRANRPWKSRTPSCVRVRST